MPEEPVVSVVIPTHNRAHLVPRAIRSALGQDYPQVEVIVVDDGSTDDTGHVLAQFDSIRTITLEQNQGGAVARNAGIRAARGEFIAFLDSDDEWLPSKTSRQVEFMQAAPQHAGVYCRHFTHDDATDTRIERFPELYTGSIRPVLLSGKCPHTVSLFMVRRSALDAVQGFDPSLSGFQDTDLWIRLSENWEFGALDEALVVVHQHSGPRVTHDPFARERALDRFLDKWGEEMEEEMGVSGVAAWRRRNLAVAHGAQVLSLVESGKRTQAVRELVGYFRVAGVSHLTQAGGLILACMLGTRVHSRMQGVARFIRRWRR